MLYNVVLLSAVQQSESAICIHISPPFLPSMHFKTPSPVESFQSERIFTNSSLWQLTPTMLHTISSPSLISCHLPKSIIVIISSKEGGRNDRLLFYIFNSLMRNELQIY